jgi:alpha-D-ribose 1-methylphosphonate 5-triphosphate synthase subunit PhnH
MTEAINLQDAGKAAACFRTILEAFSKPGKCVELPALGELPFGLNVATANLLLSLCDYQTLVWLSPSLDTKQVKDFLRFHTGAPLRTECEAATFAVCSASEFAKFYPRFNRGTDEYPDRAATAVVQVDTFAARQTVTLQGPGLRGSVKVAAQGFGSREWNLLTDDRIRFPLGVDVALTSDQSLVAIPRSTRIVQPETA